MAYRGKKKFWTYVGYMIAFSIIGGALTGIPARIFIKDQPQDAEKTNDETKKTE